MTIEEVGDGDEVFQRVETFLPHLIFMDIQLPEKMASISPKK